MVFPPHLVAGPSQRVPQMMPFRLSPAGNLISPVNDTRSYFGAGLQRDSKARQQFDWRRRRTRRRGGEGQPNPQQQSHCRGTWGGPSAARPCHHWGFCFIFLEGKGGGNQNQHGLPMSSVSLFPLPPSVISVGIGFFLPCPELCFSSDSEKKTPGKT